jgi:hypothetical protein
MTYRPTLSGVYARMRENVKQLPGVRSWPTDDMVDEQIHRFSGLTLIEALALAEADRRNAAAGRAFDVETDRLLGVMDEREHAEIMDKAMRRTKTLAAIDAHMAKTKARPRGWRVILDDFLADPLPWWLTLGLAVVAIVWGVARSGGVW